MVIAAITLFYGGLHLLWYWHTPFGQTGVLDERENLELARQLATGTLPAEPLYRAPGYPLFLSLLLRLGVPFALLPQAATAVGLLLHGLNAGLVNICARRFFARASAGWLAGLLYGLNPVLLHHATQILDGTLANTCLLLGLPAFVTLLKQRHLTVRATLGISLAWAAMALVRPQLLLVWLAFPVLWWFVTRGQPAAMRERALTLVAAGGGLGLFLIFGAWQHARTGQFRILPTQGAYNLWAANRPGAHGRYFAQSIHLSAQATHHNPTLVESRALYTRATGRPADDLDAVNAYWSRQLRESILTDPAGFAGRALRRVYYLGNNVEQYNNKTYAFHKARSPWLRVNPLGWGVVLIAATAGLAVPLTQDRRAGTAWLMLIAITGAGIAAAFVSGRFRLPLVALGSALAGGGLLLPAIWQQWRGRTRALAATALILVTTLTYSRGFDVRNDATVLQDHLLLAAAAVQTDDDALAWDAAGDALALAPQHSDALAWRVTAYFNLLLTDRAPPAAEPAWLAASHQLLALPANDTSAAARIIAALALWRNSERDNATAVWRALAEHEADARAALWLAGLEVVPPETGSGTFITLARAGGAKTEEARDLKRIATRLFSPNP